MKAAEVHNLKDDELLAKLIDAKEALRLAGTKLPLKTKFVKREADLFAS